VAFRARVGALAGPGTVRPDDPRHSAVSWAVNKLGANVYSVQRMVGHAKPSITLDVYGELWEEEHERLAERMDAALREETAAPAPLRSLR
jgi:integrase